MVHDALFLAVLWLAAGQAAVGGGGGAVESDAAGFWRTSWFEMGLEHGNPPVNRRFRVNAPGVALDPRFAKRQEVRGNGMLLIRIEEDLRLLDAAELYLELWGGHPGTAARRVTVNGRSTYPLPENGTAAGHCTHLYPTVMLRITDLVDGYNALQFACDQGTSFWGHFIVDNAALRARLVDDHPDLERLGLAGFQAAVKAAPAAGREAIELRLDVSEEHRAKIAAVDYFASYSGFDERGAGRNDGWHGFTKERRPAAIAASAAEPPFAAAWDVSMLPAQEGVAVRAAVRFRDRPALSYSTAAAGGLRIPERRGERVMIAHARELPVPFWSRDSRRVRCAIPLAMDPARIASAELHVVIWDGGRGGVEHPFTLNGRPLEVAGTGRHDVSYRRLEIDPSLLRRGDNEIELFSDTDHHGIEVLLPGPALAVRVREAGRGD